MREIKNYTHYYVTENGDVFRKWKDEFRKRKSSINKDGYYQITLKRKTFLTHRLVAETYILNPDNLPIVEHKDDNKLNNHVSNLMWSTVADNNRNAFKNGLIKIPKGQERPNSKLSNEQVKWIKENYIPRHLEFGGRALGKKFDISFQQISSIINNKKWKHTQNEK
jgi:hypothetical protein